MRIEGNTIIADSGKILEKGNIAAKTVVLSKFDSPGNWTERDMTEAEITREREEQENLAKVYAERVSELIRLRYSIDDELALSRQRETKKQEFEKYFAYCEECKTRAKKELGGYYE